MSDTATEVKDTKTKSPEKKIEKETTETVVEKKVDEESVEKDTNGESKTEKDAVAKKNGVEKESVEKNDDDDSVDTVKPVENGDTKEDAVSQKRKSDIGSGDATDSGTPAEGVSPEKKPKLEEKLENGEAEAAA